MKKLWLLTIPLLFHGWTLPERWIYSYKVNPGGFVVSPSPWSDYQYEAVKFYPMRFMGFGPCFPWVGPVVVADMTSCPAHNCSRSLIPLTLIGWNLMLDVWGWHVPEPLLALSIAVVVILKYRFVYLDPL